MGKDRAASPPRSEKNAPQAASKKDKAAKGKGGKNDKEKGGGSRPPSTQFDIAKPHWTLRVVSDGHAAVSIHQYGVNG